MRERELIGTSTSTSTSAALSAVLIQICKFVALVFPLLNLILFPFVVGFVHETCSFNLTMD